MCGDRRNEKCELREGTRCEIRDTRYEIRDTRYEMRDARASGSCVVRISHLAILAPRLDPPPITPR